PGVEVVPLDLALGALDRARDQPRLQRGLLVHQAADALHVAAEDAHQIVFERDEEARAAGVALAAGAAAELVVDPARLVPLGADDVQAPDVGDTALELDVGAAAGHVGGDGHRPAAPRVGHDS